jgi:hypothetical protein
VRDLLCVDDLDLFGREASEREALVQDLLHRLTTTPGRIINDPDFGLGVSNWLSVGVPSSASARIEAEFLKDDRVLSAAAVVEQVDEDTFTIDVEIDTVDGAFSFSTTTTREGTQLVTG